MADDPGYSLNTLLRKALDIGASDVLLEEGSPPQVRVSGEISPMTDLEALTGPQCRKLMFDALTQRQRERFEAELELDCGYEMPGTARFRINVHMQRGHVGAAIRSIPLQIPGLDQLGLPRSVATVPNLTHGLVLVTGPSGSGKSTTLAAIIDQINERRADHIVTIEDPIEFLHPHRRSVLTQREVGPDTRSFSEALRRALRQDPDVILVGELRDRETISVALTAANTGHLVLATMHTSSARETVTRIVDSFPGDEQPSIQAQLSDTLRMVITQTLCQRKDGEGRMAAAEIMVVTPAVRSLIREGKVNQLQSTLQAGRALGMQTMGQSLSELLSRNTITLREALNRCASAQDLAQAAGFGDAATMLAAAGLDGMAAAY